MPKLCTILVLLLAAAVNAAEFTSTGKNDFFILQPNEQWVYEGVEKGAKTRLTVTVLPETQTMRGVETRIVESKRSANKASTTQRSHFAINANKDIHAFDESTTLAIPAQPRLGQKLSDKVEVISLTESVKVPAGSFTNCLKIQTGDVATLYARNVGPVQIGELKLLRHGPRKLATSRQSAPQLDADPLVPIKLARAAMADVGLDAQAEEVWITAINDPALSANQRSDLIEDLNESGFSAGNGMRATPEDLPIVLNRLALIERLAPDAMDEVNYDAFAEAYKDLVNIATKLTSE